MDRDVLTLDAQALQQFKTLGPKAIDSVTERFYSMHGKIYEAFGPKGRQACRDDLAFHVEFLRSALEFGLTRPMVDYLRWLAGVLEARDIPAEHLALTLDWLSEFFATRMEATAATIVATTLARTKTQFLADDNAPSKGESHMPEPWEECEAFESALLAGDRRGATQLLDRCIGQGRSFVDTEVHMIQPALYGVGRKWQENKITVAQEHLATAIAQSVMAAGLSQASMAAANGKRVLLACVEGNAHSVGLQMVADAFQLSGWDMQFLGANVPTDALIRQIGVFKPHLLALSVSFAHQLHTVKEITARLALGGDDRPAIIIGGLAINQFDRLADRLGADGWGPDANAAVERAHTLSPQASA